MISAGKHTHDVSPTFQDGNVHITCEITVQLLGVDIDFLKTENKYLYTNRLLNPILTIVLLFDTFVIKLTLTNQTALTSCHIIKGFSNGLKVMLELFNDIGFVLLLGISMRDANSILIMFLMLTKQVDSLDIVIVI